ncbi:MAG: MmgE/PrpD family protein [Candidatus Tectimicrobiota bacterium]|nr:MAG: MmgE/PrpD family protein [Candidatus Tectomicrobia bacterium]
MTSLAHKMADFVFSLRYEDLPAPVVAAARRHLADSLACMVGAFHAEAVKAVRRYALSLGGRPEATLIGTQQKVPAGLAALVNGTMVRYLDANDIFASRGGSDTGHFSDAVPALLALAERHRHSGKELVTCVVAAYELQGALAEAFHFMRRGYHALTQVPWTLPIVAARLMGASPGAAVHACGLSGTTGMVLNSWLKPSAAIPMIKAVAVGLAAQRAVEAAALAALGVTAPEDALETAFARLGPLDSVPAEPGRFDLLGRRWTMTRNILKAYPSQIYTQAAVQAALALRRRGVTAERVETLTLYGHRNVCGGVQGSPQAFAPATREAADHSTPFVMAMALLRGRLTPKEYEGAPWENPEVRALMARIKLVREPERDRALDSEGKLGVRLVARLQDGTTEAVEVGQPKGHPDAPFDENDLLDKMGWLLEGVASSDAPRRLLAACARLETEDDVQALLRACRV